MLLSAQLIVDVLSLLINPEVQRGGKKKKTVPAYFSQL